ncbi:hypothetical protein F5880DRAFT_900609 [Lentinula raphanica]|nr:hypothetical protein F5880DRAFT_900609 [Lentinula raphanica]
MNIVYLVTLALISITCAVPVTNNKPPTDVILEPRSDDAAVVAVGIVLLSAAFCAAAFQLEHDLERPAIIQSQSRPAPAPSPQCKFREDVQTLEKGSPEASPDGSLRKDHKFRSSFFLGEGQKETPNANDKERARKAIDAVFGRFLGQFEHEQLGGKLSATDNLKIFGAHINTEFSLELKPEGLTKSEKRVVKGPCNLWFSFRGNDELWVGWAQQGDDKKEWSQCNYDRDIRLYDVPVTLKGLN